MKIASLLTLLLFPIIILSAQPSKEADRLIASLIPNKEHAVSVLVAQNGQILYEKQAGYANKDAQRAATETTIFRIGSVTKQFTAAAILKLAEMNKLSLQDPLGRHMLEFPGGDRVTIHHLLTHTSGIKSYTDHPYFILGVADSVSKEQVIKNIESMGFDFDPGDKWKYNNSAYFILGYLVEQLSGDSYDTFLRTHFFKPAGMEHTGVYDNSETYADEALGYANQAGKIKLSLDWNMSWAGGAGNLYSTAQDLYRWNEAIFKGDLLTRESLELALSEVQLNDSTYFRYGYGWMLGDYKGLASRMHSGGLQGFLSHLVYYPEIDATVVVLSNASPPLNVRPMQLEQKLTDIFFKDKLEESIEVEVDTAVYAKYTGKYIYPGGAVMTISTEQGRLYAQLTGQQKFEIFPKTDNHFFWKVVDAEIIFNVNEGMVDFATHQQNGMSFKAPRKTD